LPSSYKEPVDRCAPPGSSAVEDVVLSLRGRDWLRLPHEEREQLVEMCFRYWRSRGFPYYSLGGADIRREYSRLVAVSRDRLILGDEIQTSMVGLKVANYFHPQMWSVRTRGRRSPLECFNSDRLLRRLIPTAFKVWPERKAVNENNLRGMLRTFSRTGRVSNFRPTAAKAVYERYSRDGDTVLDFSSGYGGRLLGCLPLDRHYVGIDPCRAQVAGLRRMKARLQRLVQVKAAVTIHRACAEDLLPRLDSNSAALIFSSPPYFDTERYSDEPTQSFIKYPGYEEWLEKFIGRVIAESGRILRPRGHFVLNVADINGYRLTQDVLRLATPRFELVETLRLRLGRLPYFREEGDGAYKFEPVLVFRRKRRGRSHG
jgi:SAM-dependent methyltransferase